MTKKCQKSDSKVLSKFNSDVYPELQISFNTVEKQSEVTSSDTLFFKWEELCLFTEFKKYIYNSIKTAIIYNNI